MPITVLAPAKINLTLDITGKREDGYHFVDMVMQAVSLYDRVSVAHKKEPGISLSCTAAGIPCDSRNTVYKAAEYFLAETGIVSGVCITIEKQIPSQAGLAGGSSDAAAALLGLNDLFHLPLTTERLVSIGAKVGADVPFCLYGGTMWSTGIGTTLLPLAPMPACALVLVKPAVGVSTKEAYALCDSRGFTETPHSTALVPALEATDLYTLANSLHNDFEQVLQLAPVRKIRHELLACGALGACMSGSGPTVFGIFKDAQKAQACAARCKKEYKEVFAVHPVKHGCFLKKTV